MPPRGLNFGLLLIALTVVGCSLRPPSVQPTVDELSTALTLTNQSMPPPTPAPPLSRGDANPAGATLHTSLGEIEIAFYPEPVNTVANFAKLSRAGFYDGVTFHRVIKGFMVQSGDPNSKDDDWSNDGTGGPGYTLADEINQHKLVRGSLAMANAGPDTNGSQFFIVTAEATPWLDGKHTNFGQVVGGMEVLAKIESAATNAQDHPTTNISITSVTIK